MHSARMGNKFNWPHAPMHCLGEHGTYMVTAATYQKAAIFTPEERLKHLCGGLLKYAGKHDWALHAWAVFPNHYHFVATSPGDGSVSLKGFLREFHSRSARWVNARDVTPGRKVWHNYWESHITHDTSYCARLNYVHQNAVKHGIVPVANHYPWCSAGWFERTAPAARVKTIYSFKTDRISVKDDY